MREGGKDLPRLHSFGRSRALYFEYGKDKHFPPILTILICQMANYFYLCPVR